MAEDLVGRRVVLRRRVGERDGRPVFTDILGELVEAVGALVIRRADGETVTVPRSEVHRLKAVPPGREEILSLFRVEARGWPGPEREFLGEWVLQAGEGWTRRANSALVAGDPGVPVVEALRHVEDWYTARRLTPRLIVPLPAMAPTDHAADRLGWVLDVEVEVLTAPTTPAPLDPGIRFAGAPDAGWAAAYQARTVPPVGVRILTAPETVTFGSIMDGDTTVAIGRGVVVDGWLGIAAMEVLPEHRRRGLAARMLRGLLAWGAASGATRCYVQVESDNVPALALYRGLGFTGHHRYRNRHRDPVDRTGTPRAEGIS
jgi:ribosomal protein S18 acetylase RimI-like enzyme